MSLHVKYPISLHIYCILDTSYFNGSLQLSNVIRFNDLLFFVHPSPMDWFSHHVSTFLQHACVLPCALLMTDLLTNGMPHVFTPALTDPSILILLLIITLHHHLWHVWLYCSSTVALLLMLLGWLLQMGWLVMTKLKVTNVPPHSPWGKWAVKVQGLHPLSSHLK